MTTDNASIIPLWLLYEEDVEEWRAAQAAATVTWLATQNFKGEKHRAVLVPDSSGAPCAAVAGLGKRQGEVSMWHAAGIADRLPARRFRLAQEWSAASATQIALGFAYGGYRFERYRQVKTERSALLEPPPNADMRHVAVASEALALARDWINTPACDFGPGELAQAAREVASRHGAACREWVGEALRDGNFPAIHAVGRASAQAPRLIELRWSPPGAAALPRIAIVGKGVCFDSGGLDIKPSAGMALMKKDMGGAAVALALAHMLMSARIAPSFRC